MEPKPGKNYELDRKNVNGNYEKDNCQWTVKGAGKKRRYGPKTSKL